MVYNSNHIKFIRCASEYCAGQHFRFRYSKYCLAEECITWGKGSYSFIFAGLYGDYTASQYNVVRRCVSRRDEHYFAPGGNHWCSFVSYWGDNTYFQNCISIDGYYIYAGTPNPPYFTKAAFYTANGSSNYNADGCISINDHGQIAQFESGASPVNFRNNSCILSSVIGTYGIYFRDGNSVTIENNLLSKSMDAAGCIQEAGTASLLSAKNNIIYNNNKGLVAVASANHSYNLFYINTNNYVTTSVGAGEITGTNPLTNGLLYPTRIETASVLKSTGSSGGQVGATILKRIGVDETLYGDTDWNTLTDVNLWPFPNEDAIKNKMKVYNSNGENGARGFCSAGKRLNGVEDITLTSYIWEYLGNAIPSDIYSSSITVNAPSNLVLTSISTSNIHLEWTDNSSNEQYFRIERKQTGSYDEIASLSAGVTYYTDGNLISGTTYTYKVRASNGSTYSNYCTEVSTVTQGSVPAIPSPPAQPTGQYIIAVTSYSVEFGWSDNSSNEDGFNIKREIGIDYYYFLSSVTANTTSYIDTGLLTTTTYYYKIRAYNSAGNSDYCGEVSTMTLDVPVIPTPNIPSILGFVNITTFSAILNWIDTSDNELGFKIDRSTDNSYFVQIDSVTANIESYTNNSLTSGLTYYYKIRAFNESGNSDYSDIVSVTINSQEAGGTLNVGEILVTGQKANGIFSSTNTINIEFQGSTQGEYTFTVKDLKNTEINSDSKTNVNNGIFTLDLSGYKSGVYQIKINGNGINNSRKFVVIN